jgi:DNA mismatch repair ATPase MutS
LLEVSEEPHEHPIVSALQSLDIDAMTPRQAQDALYELKRLLEGNR